MIEKIDGVVPFYYTGTEKLKDNIKMFTVKLPTSGHAFEKLLYEHFLSSVDSCLYLLFI